MAGEASHASCQRSLSVAMSSGALTVGLPPSGSQLAGGGVVGPGGELASGDEESAAPVGVELPLGVPSEPGGFEEAPDVVSGSEETSPGGTQTGISFVEVGPGRLAESSFDSPGDSPVASLSSAGPAPGRSFSDMDGEPTFDDGDSPHLGWVLESTLAESSAGVG